MAEKGIIFSTEMVRAILQNRAKRKPLMSLCKAQNLYGVEATTFQRPRYVEEGKCEWCGKEITSKRRTSCCSPECSRNFGIATSSVYYANVGSRGGYRNHIFRRDNYTCRICGEWHVCYSKPHGIPLPTTDGELQIHHIKEVSKGGTDEPGNLLTVCVDCHKKIHKIQER